MNIAFPRESVANNNLKRDYHAESSEGVQLPLITVFHRDCDQLRHFWTSEILFAPCDPGQDPRHTGTIDEYGTSLTSLPKVAPPIGTNRSSMTVATTITEPTTI